MNKNSLFRGISVLSLVLLAACGHAIHGNEQAVEITPKGLPPGVTTHCLIENELLAWEVVAPGTASVERSKSDLRVECRTPSGWRGRASASPSPSPYSLAGQVGPTFGTGAGAVNLHAGGAWVYPSKIEVPMHAMAHAMQSIAEAEAGPLMPLPPRPPRATAPRPRPRPAVTAPPKPVCDCVKPEAPAAQ